MWQDLTLSDKARMIDLAVKSGITDLATIQQVYNTFAEGGDLGEAEPPAERRKYEDKAVTLEAYKEIQRQAIRDAAVRKALTRTTGIAPMVNGEPAASCLYTATDNFGKKYRVAYNPELMTNPEKYGWEVAGPLTQDMLGYLYIMSNKNGIWDHGNLITGYDDNGNALISYSQGHAGGKPAPTRQEWEEVAKTQMAFSGTHETYEEYVNRMAKINSPENDYKRNKPIWETPGYETLRFIGTPEDNARWEEEFNALEGYPTPILVSDPLNNYVVLKNGGKIHIKKENRGKFTALKKRTGHSASWFKAHGTPAQKRMATFALNARKWHH